jgi:hypothetical protein
MDIHLYKVSPPRSDMLFHPSTFWHSADWESSTTTFRSGYGEDNVLYAGDFDEVGIHLFPRVRVVRLRAQHADASALLACGIQAAPGVSSYVFIPEARRAEVEVFHPTIFTFHADGFTRVRNGEYMSRLPQRAISCETMPIQEAIRQWRIGVHYVGSMDSVVAALAGRKIYFEEQT